jgi:predicted nucleic acid-binding Zn ribbon protein
VDDDGYRVGADVRVNGPKGQMAKGPNGQIVTGARALPTYVYEVLDKKGEPTGESFEIVQSIKDEPLTKEPETGRPVRRAIVTPTLGLAMSKAKNSLSNKNLERLGFTKYERKGNGYMERTAGKQGPKSIAAD